MGIITKIYEKIKVLYFKIFIKQSFFRNVYSLLEELKKEYPKPIKSEELDHTLGKYMSIKDIIQIEKYATGKKLICPLSIQPPNDGKGFVITGDGLDYFSKEEHNSLQKKFNGILALATLILALYSGVNLLLEILKIPQINSSLKFLLTFSILLIPFILIIHLLFKIEL